LGAGFAGGFTVGLTTGRALATGAGADLVFADALGAVGVLAFGAVLALDGGCAFPTGFFAVTPALCEMGLREGVLALAGDFRAGLAGVLAMGILGGGRRLGVRASDRARAALHRRWGGSGKLQILL